MNLNKIYIIGRLVADPEIRNTQSGQQVANFRMATNRVWNNSSGEKQEQVEYHSIVAWARLADIIGQYLKKGSLAMIEGRIQTRSWIGQDNQKRYSTEIVAENIQLGPRSTNPGYSSTSNNQGYQSQPTQQNNNEDKKEKSPVTAPVSSAEDNIPVINENEPIVNDNEIEEKEVELKDIPF